jgi:hypothetical protein
MKHTAHYHIHFDGKVITPELEDWAINNLGFWWDNFLHEDGESGYAPERHLTQKPKSGHEFRAMKSAIFGYLRTYPEQLTGYVECEVISKRETIPHKEFDSLITFPFSFTTEMLAPDTFRESEIHVSMNRKESDPRLLERLKQSGLLVAFNERQGDTRVIFTVQGYRDQIGEIWRMLHSYLLKVGGAVDCNMKEEVIADYWLSSPDYPLPPVVNAVKVI